MFVLCSLLFSIPRKKSAYGLPPHVSTDPHTCSISLYHGPAWGGGGAVGAAVAGG